MRQRMLVSAVMVLFVFASNPIQAQSIRQIGPNFFEAGIPSIEFEYFAAPSVNGRQRQSNWCWAASIQMVLNYHGLYVRQEQVVDRVFGEEVNRPAGPSEIMSALSGWAPDVRGRFSGINATTVVMQGSDIVNDLAYKWPIIVGLKGAQIGHAYVLTAVRYNVNLYNNQPIFQSVVLRDPWPSSSSRQEMSWEEFSRRVNFMARVYVTRY